MTSRVSYPLAIQTINRLIQQFYQEEKTKMGILSLRLFLIIITSVSGYIIGGELGNYNTFAWGGLLAGLVFAVFVLSLETKIEKAPLRTVLGGFVGLVTGLMVANLLFFSLFLLHLPKNPGLNLSFYFLVNTILGYLGITAGLKKGSKLDISLEKIFSKKQNEGGRYPKILDTSVIIDGRIADICETSFLEGPFIIPQFILQELRHIADSADSIKRTRGRRGLDILNKLQKQADITIEITDQDFPKIEEVDNKLVALAQKINGKIITNDFNLNKVAEIQGVSVLNINQLANALKPVVLPGEMMNVHILKEGKESGQGVAYLDDGTMVVVENGRKYLGKIKDVSVTSVLQTTAGRMIFTAVKGESSPQYLSSVQS